MKTRIDEWITTVVFCLFLAAFSVLFLILPKQDYSEVEKRELQAAPQYSWENLSSGKFGKDIESYMADHIPGRSFFVGVNAYAELLSGRQVTKDIYLASGNRLVEKPVQWDEERAQNNMTVINEFAEKYGGAVDFAIVPSSGWAVQDSIIGLSDLYQDEAYIKKLYAMAGENVQTRDILSVYKNYNNPESLYYRTDHHWTSLGAYTAYAAYMEMLGLPSAARTDFTVKTAEGFRGTTYTRSSLWLTPAEPVEMWHGSAGITVEFDHKTYNSVFFEDRLKEQDKYLVYLDGNHGFVVLQNPNAPVAETLLVVRDSYSNCLGPFLAETYQKVVLVDLRSYTDAVLDYCILNQVDRVLVLYSLFNFMDDTNIYKLGTTLALQPENYDAVKLEEVAGYKGDYYDYQAQYGIPGAKLIDNTYRVAYLGTDHVAVVYFYATGEQMGQKISGEIYKVSCTNADFYAIAEGSTMEQVRQIDPDGDYTATSTGNDTGTSTHFTSDGYMITMEYDQDIVTNITVELI